MKTALSFLTASLLFAGSLCAADDLVLTRDGRTDYVIVVPRHASPATGRGAQELARHLKLMSGADFKIIDDASPAPAHAMLLGIAPPGETLDAGADLGADGFVIRTVGERVYVAGPGPRGSSPLSWRGSSARARFRPAFTAPRAAGSSARRSPPAHGASSRWSSPSSS